MLRREYLLKGEGQCTGLRTVGRHRTRGIVSGLYWFLPHLRPEVSKGRRKNIAGADWENKISPICRNSLLLAIRQNVATERALLDNHYRGSIRLRDVRCGLFDKFRFA